MDNEKPPQGHLFAAAVYLLEISTAVKVDEAGALFYRLADLIDRRTCQMINKGDYVPSHVFRRKVFRVSHFEHDDTYITSWDEIETIPRHCPWCGAEVVDDE